MGQRLEVKGVRAKVGQRYVWYLEMYPNPYGQYVEGRDVLASLDETPRRIGALVRGWPRERDELDAR